MGWFTFQKKQYALTSDAITSLLGTKITSPMGQHSLQTLAWADNALDDEATLHRLLTGAKTKSGEVAISLPLNFFETVALSINKIPDEAVGRVLPFHLAKNFDTPLDDFIYDWLITKRQKDTLNLTVFLFPKKAFQAINRTLGQYKLTCTTLEPDVFSVIAYLESNERLATDSATLCVLLWPNSLSVCVYDQEKLALIRNLPLSQPEIPPQQEQEAKGENQAEPESKAEEAAGQMTTAGDSQAILADFLVQTKEEEQAPPQISQPEPALELADKAPMTSSWENYCSMVFLEVLRTRDYFTSIIKGNPLKTVILGGTENIWDLLAPEIKNGLDCEIEPLVTEDIAPQNSASLTAMAIGSLCR